MKEICAWLLLGAIVSFAVAAYVAVHGWWGVADLVGMSLTAVGISFALYYCLSDEYD